MERITTNRYETKRELRVDICRCSPVLLSNTLGANQELFKEWCSIGRIKGIRILCDVLGLRESIQLLSNRGKLGALHPSFRPVTVWMSTRRSTNGVKHPLSWVLGRLTRWSAKFLKISDHSSGVVADVAKVYRFAALCEQQKSVELLEDDCRWLMDGAENCLAMVGKLLDE
jgi:hypothetical protein